MTAERATILVADDEPHIRRILQYLLEQAGYDVVVAADGEDALREVDRCAPDLVLLDVMMPRLDGFSVLRSIRSSLETARLPVILLTAKGQSDEKVRGLRGGANDYIIKPFDQEELLLRIYNMLEHARAQREANPLDRAARQSRHRARGDAAHRVGRAVRDHVSRHRPLQELQRHVRLRPRRPRDHPALRASSAMRCGPSA